MVLHGSISGLTGSLVYNFGPIMSFIGRQSFDLSRAKFEFLKQRVPNVDGLRRDLHLARRESSSSQPDGLDELRKPVCEDPIFVLVI